MLDDPRTGVPQILGIVAAFSLSPGKTTTPQAF